MKRVLVLLAATLAVVGCTKESPYVTQPKVLVADKSTIDTTHDFLLEASLGDSSRTSTAASPYWMGQTKIVRFKWSEKSLQVVSVDLDPRFQGNPTNQKLILEIPVEHLDYECDRDQFGECTNKEKEADDITWQQKTKFRADFSATKIAEVPMLPVELQNAFGSSCFDEVEEHFLDYTLEPDAMNVRIQKTFQVKKGCLSSTVDSIDELLSNTTFTTIYHYSMVRRDDIVSPDFKQVVYPVKDQNTFGFFTTDVKTLDVDNRNVIDGTITYMNHWNPNRKNITYYLSDSFKEFPTLKAASQKAVDAINATMAKANPEHPIHLDLKDADGRLPGDIRNSMIVLVKDPMATGLLGYGPAATDPLTGEIVSARVVMYEGIANLIIRNTYNEFVDEQKAQLAQTHSVRQIKFAVPKPSGPSMIDTLLNSTPTLAKGATLKLATFGKSSARGLSKAIDAKAIRTMAYDYKANTTSTTSPLDRVAAMSKYCFYPAELFNAGDALKGGLAQLSDYLKGDLKYWDDLDNKQQQDILNIMVPYVWVPILVHELGHNMGLRHNFQGSEDKDNYYTAAELKDLGIDHEMKFSSVMDYPYSELHDLPVMGKYDLAALRFGYARKVALADGTLAPVESTIADLEKKVGGDGLKAYGYCTDEHVDANAGCKRFDEGTTLDEIAQHYADAYEHDYRLRNFRNNLYNYSLLNEGAYAGYVENLQHYMRLDFELMERINNEFGATEQDWNTIPVLQEIRKAVDIMTDTYIKTIKTPDMLCAIAKTSDPNTVIAVLPPPSTVYSCFDEGLSAGTGTVIVGQAGKSFTSRKSPANDNPYADQIDVRGIWVDKMIAVNQIVRRKLDDNLFDKYTENLFHDARAGNLALQTLVDVFADELTTTATFTTPDGATFSGDVRYSIADSHVIHAPLSKSVVALTGIEEGEVPFMKEMLRTIRRESTSDVHADIDRQVLQTFEVFSAKNQQQAPFNPVAFADVGTTRYYARAENSVALLAINGINADRVLDPVDPAKLQEILKALQADPNAQPAAGATEAEKAAYGVKADLIEMYLSGRLKSESYYAQVLKILDETVANRPHTPIDD